MSALSGMIAAGGVAVRKRFAWVAVLATLCGVMGLAPAVQADNRPLATPGVRVAPKIAGGTPIMDAATVAPWVVSIWFSRSGSFPDFICTGTVISPDEIVTASHCVQDRGYYYVYTGANELGRGDRVALEAIISNRAYSAKTFRNDVAVMRPLEPILLPSYPRLATASDLRWARLSQPLLQIQGWGANGMMPSDYLRTGDVILAGGFASKIWESYDPKTMLATWGQKDVKRYTSTCPGDSGGPLLGDRDGALVLLGITSWGAADCRVGVPSIFTSVVPFGGWLASARRALPQQAATNNIAKPEELRGAQISNDPRLGSPISCAAEYSRNATVTYSWSGIGVPAGSTRQELWIIPEMAGQFITCTATAQGRLGKLTSSVSVSLPFKPEIWSLDISGVSSYPSPGEVAECDFRTNTKLDKYEFEWWVRTRDNSYREQLSVGETLTLTQDLIVKLAGKQLVCRATAYAPMGVASAGVYMDIAALRPPDIRYVQVVKGGWTASSARVGDTISCSYQVVAPDSYSSTMGWYLIPQSARVSDSSPMPSDAILVGGDASLSVTQALVDQAKDYSLRCAVSATTWQGTTYRSSGTVYLS